MKYLKLILKRGLLGMAFGVFINQTIFAIFACTMGLNGNLEVSMLFKQFIISAIAGFYFSASSVIFNVSNWSSLKQTVLHFIATSIVYFPVAIYAKWMPNASFGRIIFIITYITIYVIVWFSFKSYWTKKIKELNMSLERRNKLN
ncbi:DUF3021 domain-containing protein [Haloimpatiens sp. FM7330]|uniref:DUF3021 domain-containing protein n=1 Tax=Haloimpatiens sp. FM7330 TaxID=3298610 RepID=UPI00362A83DE